MHYALTAKSLSQAETCLWLLYPSNPCSICDSHMIHWTWSVLKQRSVGISLTYSGECILKAPCRTEPAWKTARLQIDGWNNNETRWRDDDLMSWDTTFSFVSSSHHIIENKDKDGWIIIIILFANIIRWKKNASVWLLLDPELRWGRQRGVSRVNPRVASEWRRCPVTLMDPDQEQLKRFNVQERLRLHASRDHLMTTITARSTATHNALALVLFVLATKTWTAEKFWSAQHRCFSIWGSQVSSRFFMLEFCLEISLFFFLLYSYCDEP